MTKGPNPGSRLFGIFTLLFGSLILLAGVFADEIGLSTDPENFGMAQIALAVAGAGISLMGMILVCGFLTISFEILANFGLFFSSITIFILLIEFILFPNLLTFVPLKYQSFLPEFTRLLAHSSKDARRTVILPCSYPMLKAAEIGSISELITRATVHFIQGTSFMKLDTDVISFGRGAQTVLPL